MFGSETHLSSSRGTEAIIERRHGLGSYMSMSVLAVPLTGYATLSKLFSPSEL